MEKTIFLLPLFNWTSRVAGILEGKLCEKEGCISRKAHIFSTPLCYWEPGSWWLGEHHRLGLEDSTANGLTWRGTALPSALSMRLKTSSFPDLSQPWCHYKFCGYTHEHIRVIVGICWGISNTFVCVCGTHTYGRPPCVHVARCESTQQVGLPCFPPPLHSAPRPRLANGKG